MKKSKDSGFTLIEVMLASTIVGVSLVVLCTAASRCLAIAKKSKDYQTAQWVLARGEADHPLYQTNDVMKLDVSDVEYADGYIFSRKVEDDEDEDGLYLVKEKVSWGNPADPMIEEVVLYVLQDGDLPKK